MPIQTPHSSRNLQSRNFNKSQTPGTGGQSSIIKLKNGKTIDAASVQKMKSMMIGRAKTINGNENDIYFPPVR